MPRPAHLKRYCNETAIPPASLAPWTIWFIMRFDENQTRIKQGCKRALLGGRGGRHWRGKRGQNP